MTHELRLALLGGALPAALTLALLFPLWRRRASKLAPSETGESKTTQGPFWIAPLMLALGFALAYRIPGGGLELWPQSVNERYPHAIATLAIVALLEGLIRLPSPVAYILRGASAAVGAWILIGPLPETAVPDHDKAGWIGLAAVASVITASLAESGARILPRGATPAALGLLIAGSAPLFFFAAVLALIAQSVIGLAAVLFACGITGLLCRGFSMSRGTAPLFAGSWVLLAIASVTHNDPAVVNIPAVALIALAPAGLAAATIVKSKHLVVRSAAASIGIAAPLALAGMSVAIQQSPDPEPEQEELDAVDLKKLELESIDYSDYYSSPETYEPATPDEPEDEVIDYSNP